MQTLAAFFCVLFSTLAMGNPQPYQDREEVLDWVQQISLRNNIPAEFVLSALSAAEYRDDVIQLISKPAERVLTWGDYRNIFLDQARVENGVVFMRNNASALEEAERAYGVPREILTAIIGVETRYGKVMGRHRVIDALVTLGFDYPPRRTFFIGELEKFLLFTYEYEKDPLSFKGSYAGAMGMAQFMPSSYLAYAADYDDDGFSDLWENSADAIWSVANYLANHGWRPQQPIRQSVEFVSSDLQNRVSPALELDLTASQLHRFDVALPESLQGAAREDEPVATLMALELADSTEYWLGFQNFYAITRYNHSHLYAMAVSELAEQIAAHAERQ